MATRRKFDWGAITQTIKEKENKGSFNEDITIYKPKIKDDGTAQAIIRFLPPPVGEDLPFVKLYNHGWQGVNGWFINNCPTTIGKQCPVCRENSRIWDEDQDTARPRSRKPSFYANILVIKDPQAPENEGKVFKFRYGVKIHEKIMEKLNPENPDIDPMVPVFDYDNGANFKLKIKTIKSTIGGRSVTYPNYDSSVFAEPTPIGLSDKELDDIDAQLHSLASIVDESQFKSYEQLASEFTKKTGIVVSTNENYVQEQTETPRPKVTKEETPKQVAVTTDDAEDEESEDEFFENLQNQ